MTSPPAFVYGEFTNHLEESMDGEKVLLKVSEAAAMIGVSRAWLYRELLTPGVVPVVRCGRSVRVPARALRAWADAQEEPWSAA